MYAGKVVWGGIEQKAERSKGGREGGKSASGTKKCQQEAAARSSSARGRRTQLAGAKTPLEAPAWQAGELEREGTAKCRKVQK